MYYPQLKILSKFDVRFQKKNFYSVKSVLVVGSGIKPVLSVESQGEVSVKGRGEREVGRYAKVIVLLVYNYIHHHFYSLP